MSIVLKALHTGQEVIDRALSALVESLRPLTQQLLLGAFELQASRAVAPSGTPLLFSVAAPLTRDLAMVAGTTHVIPHPIGRAPRGWWVVYQSGPASVYEVAPAAPYNDRARYLCLAVSANVTARVVVYLWRSTFSRLISRFPRAWPSR